jgi:hypothetical protein
LRVLPEPSSTARIWDGFNHAWLRRPEGWYLPYPRQRQPQVDRSWSWLFYEFGPQFLRIDLPGAPHADDH